MSSDHLCLLLYPFPRIRMRHLSGRISCYQTLDIVKASSVLCVVSCCHAAYTGTRSALVLAFDISNKSLSAASPPQGWSSCMCFLDTWRQQLWLSNSPQPSTSGFFHSTRWKAILVIFSVYTTPMSQFSLPINLVWNLCLKRKCQFSLFCDSLPVWQKNHFGSLMLSELSCVSRNMKSRDDGLWRHCDYGSSSGGKYWVRCAGCKT